MEFAGEHCCAGIGTLIEENIKNAQYAEMGEGPSAIYLRAKKTFQMFKSKGEKPLVEMTIDEAVMFADFVALIVCGDSLITKNMKNKEEY